MKLYTTPGGQWAGTEKDWKAAMKAEGIDLKTYTGIKQKEVPTSKAELLEFLTFHNVNVINPQATAVVGPAGGDPSPPAAPPAGTPVEPIQNLDEAFRAAPRAKQVELAVGLLDRLEAMTRNQ